jgi:hypothetical protein
MDRMFSDIILKSVILKKFCDVPMTHIGAPAVRSRSLLKRFLQYSCLHKNWCLEAVEKYFKFLGHFLANAID